AGPSTPGEGLALFLPQLLDGAAAEHGLGLRRGRLAPSIRPLAPLLDQEPLLAIAGIGGANEGVSTLDLLAEEEDLEIALIQALLDGQRLAAASLRDVLEDPAVPDDHRSRSVLALRDHAFELQVLERVVLGSHREPLVAGVDGRALGDRPGGEDAVDLEPE